MAKNYREYQNFVDRGPQGPMRFNGARNIIAPMHNKDHDFVELTQSASVARGVFPESDWFGAVLTRYGDSSPYRGGGSLFINDAIFEFISGLHGLNSSTFISTGATSEFFRCLRDFDRYTHAFGRNIPVSEVESILPTYAELVAQERVLEASLANAWRAPLSLDDSWITKVLNKVVNVLGLSGIIGLVLLIKKVLQSELSAIANARGISAKMTAVAALLSRLASRAFHQIVADKLGPAALKALRNSLAKLTGRLFGGVLVAAAIAFACVEQLIF